MFEQQIHFAFIKHCFLPSSAPMVDNVPLIFNEVGTVEIGTILWNIQCLNGPDCSNLHLIAFPAIIVKM